MSRRKVADSLSPATLQSWSLLNETMRSWPELRLIATVVVIELLSRTSALSTEAATGLKTGFIAAEVIGAISGGSGVTGGAAGAAAITGATAIAAQSKQVALGLGKAGVVGLSALAAAPVAPVAAILGTMVSVGLLSEQSARVKMGQIEKLDRRRKQGALDVEQYTREVQQLLVGDMGGE